VQQLMLGPCNKPIRYMKHMAKQCEGLDLGFMDSTRNLILVREPKGLILSFHKAMGHCSVHDTCFPDQVSMLETMVERGQRPIVVVVEDLLAAPEVVLPKLCDELSIDYTPRMLSWEAGPKACDGVWAYHWYANTHNSTGFDRAVQTADRPLPAELEAVHDECVQLFDQLTQKGVRI